MLRVIGIIALVWLGLIVFGAVFKFLIWAVLIGAVVAVGAATYKAVSNKLDHRAIR